MDEADSGSDARTPIKRLGSTRKLVVYNNIRSQLSEQLKWLEARVEAQTGLAAELHDYFRRRAELEHEYSRGLDKLAKTLRTRNRDNKNKREEWSVLSSSVCWERVVSDTEALGREHAFLAEVYGTRATARLASAGERVARLHRAARDIAVAAHDDILRCLADLHHAMKLHAALAHDWRAAADKLRVAARARHLAASNNKKLKAHDKELAKRRSKHTEAKLRAVRARAAYVLSVEMANATLHKYFTDDLSDIIDCMDIGYTACVSRALRLVTAADERRAAVILQQARNMAECASELCAEQDKRSFLESHAAFAPPRSLHATHTAPQDCEVVEGGEECGVGGGEGESEVEDGGTGEAVEHAQAELRTLHAQLQEAVKTLHETERSLLAAIEIEECEGGETSEGGDGGSLQHQQLDTEEFYVSKLREFVLEGSRAARLESVVGCGDVGRARRGCGGRARVFGASLEAQLAGSGRDLPLVLVSCCRVIQLYGLRHQGIFRVSGSQVEISALRAEFERGADPLARVTDASDINSVAGLLKLYVRSLRPPLFPPLQRDRLLALARLPIDAFLPRMRDFLQALPRPHMLVLRYLFAFLNHISEYSEWNMMDAWNLAICLGPTLVAGHEERDQVSAQNLLNELVKQLIVHHTAVFPQHPPALYRRLDPPAPPPRRPEREVEDRGEEGNREEKGERMQPHTQTTANEQTSRPDSEDKPREEMPERAGTSDAEADNDCTDESVPDLVLDLPLGEDVVENTDGTACNVAACDVTVCDVATSPPSAADTFLLPHNTLKKKQTSQHLMEEPGGGGSGGRGSKPTVPAKPRALLPNV